MNELGLKEQYCDYLYFSFSKENIQKQVICGKYLLDFVLFDKIAIEIDENGHKDYDKNNKNIREQYIENQGYFIIRHNPNIQQPFELIENIIRILDRHLDAWAS